MDTKPQNDPQSLPDMRDEDAGRGRAAHPGSAAQQEWGAMNAGLTGDKVAHRDISSAPMATDDEAGGGVSGAGMTPQPRGPAEHARDPNRANERVPPAPWLWIVVALVAAVVLGVVLIGALR